MPSRVKATVTCVDDFVRCHLVRVPFAWQFSLEGVTMSKEPEPKLTLRCASASDDQLQVFGLDFSVMGHIEPCMNVSIINKDSVKACVVLSIVSAAKLREELGAFIKRHTSPPPTQQDTVLDKTTDRKSVYYLNHMSVAMASVDRTVASILELLKGA